MQDIIKIYDYYTLVFPDSEKTIKLIYKISEYQVLKNQNKKYIKRLRKCGKTIKFIRSKNGDKFYYKLYAQKIFTINQKMKTINQIFKIKNSIGQTLIDEIKEKQSTRNWKKTTQDNLIDCESKMLDIMADYLLAENEKDLYTNYKMDKIQSKEVPLMDGEIMKDSYRSNKSITKRQKNGWENSNTYRMNMIFSYDEKQEKIPTNNIWNNTLVRQEPSDFYRSGIINKYEKYNSMWVDVDVDGVFEYKDELFQIFNYNPYKKTNKNKKDKETDYEMDKILIFEQYDNLYFFDMDIYQIDNKYIKKC